MNNPFVRVKLTWKGEEALVDDEWSQTIAIVTRSRSGDLLRTHAHTKSKIKRKIKIVWL